MNSNLANVNLLRFFQIKSGQQDFTSPEDIAEAFNNATILLVLVRL